jgi:hypothetical protein
MDTLPIFSRENSTFSSTAPQELFPTEEPFDLIDFMSVAQRRMVDFLPITWQPALEAIGGGGSADISQSLINLRTSFAFKRLVRRRNRRNNINLQVLISEILVLQSEPIRAHPNIVNLLGICWEFEAESGSIAPVLVFPKAHLGDLQTYMSTERRKTIGFETRLGLSIHIAQAIATLHDCSEHFSIM